MTTIAALRTLMGEEWFEKSVEWAKETPPVEAATLNALSSMAAEPPNSGLSIDQAGDLLEVAVDETFDLPHLSKLVKK